MAAFSPSDPLLWLLAATTSPTLFCYCTAIAATRSFLLHLVTLHCSLAWTRLPLALLSTAHAVLFRFMRSARVEPWTPHIIKYVRIPSARLPAYCIRASQAHVHHTPVLRRHWTVTCSVHKQWLLVVLVVALMLTCHLPIVRSSAAISPVPIPQRTRSRACTWSGVRRYHISFIRQVSRHSRVARLRWKAGQVWLRR